MAFNGSYFIKVGTYEIPLTLMRAETYKSMPAQRQDLDSYVDADGYLHRTVLAHTRAKLEFYTPKMSLTDFLGFMNNITAQYTNGLERKVHLTYFEEEYGNYVEGDFYMPATLEIPYYNKKIVDETRIAFIEY